MKRQERTVDMKQTGYKFFPLTPTDNADLGIYESALDFVFENDRVKNVALSGAYGAGKSSILASYKKKHPDKKFLHISLAHFNSEDKENKHEVDASKEKPVISTESLLEGKILNQLIHQISPDRIPRTNFRVKKGCSKWRNIRAAIFATIGLFLGLYIFLFPLWVSFLQTLSTDWLKSILAFSGYAESRLLAGVAFLAISGIFIHRIIHLQENRHILKRAGVSGIEIEIFEDCNDSYFDKYLNEVLYLFAGADADVIVFEDIDRYNTSRIFERLHEINILVNNDRKKNHLRFFYLMRDDIFISKDRTKFFDFIIPIVPVVDGSNSFDKFLECFQNSGINHKDKKSDVGIEFEFLQGLSLYIDDMRILQNICNEFAVYHSRLSTTEQDPNKMLALIAYKNLFPQDFAELQLGQGFLFEIIGGNGKECLISSEKTRLNGSLETKNNELTRVKAEPLTEDELSLVYVQKIYPTSNCYAWPSVDRKQRIDSNRQNQQHKNIIDEYDSRVIHAANDVESKDNRIARVENEISCLNNKLISLSGKRLCEIITRENIDTFFNKTSFKSETGATKPFEDIKDSPYFSILKYLVREGFVDETYSDYMTYFYENSLSRTDKMFLRSVTDRKAKEASYKLDKADMVVSRLPLAYFEQEETLNYALFEFLLSDYNGSRQYINKTKKFLEQISANNLYDFLIEYALAADSIETLVKIFATEWDSFLSDFFVHTKMSKKPSDPNTKNDIFVKKFALVLFRLVGEQEEQEEQMSFIDDDSASKLVQYISNSSDFLNMDIAEIREMANGIRQLEIKFATIDAATANRELLGLIYADNSYVINYKNILTILQEYYQEPELSKLATGGYTIIMSDKESPLAKYINDNIDLYVGVILEKCNGKINDSQECAVLIINNNNIEKAKRTTYISYLNTVISDLSDIEDSDFWGGLLKNSKSLQYSAKNIVAYFSKLCEQDFDDLLINFINSQKASISFQGTFRSDDEKETFFDAVVNATSLSNEIYKKYIEQSDFCCNNFDIEGLPTDKLSILDELGKIKMTSGSLQFIREHYKNYLYAFIIKHLNDYVGVISDTSLFKFEEVLALLDEQIDDEMKIKLLEGTQEEITVVDKEYSDIVFAYILQNNFDEIDFDKLAVQYENFGQQKKSAILALSIQRINKQQAMPDSASLSLISDILSSGDLEFEAKQDIFVNFSPKASNDEIKEWLGNVGLSDFLKIYEESLRPKFEKTEINKAVLEIFKKRHLISNYELDENSGKYKIIRRRKPLSMEND